jgi:hypothetical protein
MATILLGMGIDAPVYISDLAPRRLEAPLHASGVTLRWLAPRARFR